MVKSRKQPFFATSVVSRIRFQSVFHHERLLLQATVQAGAPVNPWKQACMSQTTQCLGTTKPGI
eukprot:5690143-Amphidinium_carterae.1